MRPFEIRSSSPTEIERLICEATVAPAQYAVARKHPGRLRGELDNIVMMALRKEPRTPLPIGPRTR